MYIFMKVCFKTNLLMWFSHFQTQQLKTYSWFIFPIFDPALSKKTSFSNLKGVVFWIIIVHLIILGVRITQILFQLITVTQRGSKLVSKCIVPRSDMNKTLKRHYKVLYTLAKAMTGIYSDTPDLYITLYLNLHRLSYP